MKNLSIGTRLGLAFGSLLLLMGAVALIAIHRVGIVSDGLKQSNEVNAVKQRHAINFRGSVHDRAISLRDVTLVATPADAQKHLDDIKLLANNYSKSAGPLDQIFAQSSDISAEEKAALERIKLIEARTLPLISKVIELRLADKQPEAVALLLSQASPAFSEWLASINALIDLEEAMNVALAADVNKVTSSFTMLIAGLFGVAVAVGLLAAWRTTRGISQGLNSAIAAAERIGNGDLRQAAPVEGTDQIAQLVTALNKAQGSLVTIVQQFRSSADSIGTASTEIASGSQDLSTRSEQASSNLQLTASSLQQLTGTVN